VEANTAQVFAKLGGGDITIRRIKKGDSSAVKKQQQLILVVDDDQEILRVLNRSLETEGYDVVLATDGRSALALLEEHVPDLVLLDVVMPGIDGLQVLAHIRERSEVPVIMLSVMREVTSLRDAIALGADDYMRKPVRISELLARIKAKLRRAEQGILPSDGR